MTNNTPDYNDNLYFEEKMDCKNCPYTDEYCASGECTSQSPRNGSQKGYLTSQWKKGELPEGHYYIKTHNETNIDEYVQWYKDHGIPSEKSFAYFNVTEVLDKVPSYEVWMEKTKSLKVLAEAYCKEKQQNAQLKDLLKEWVQFEIEENPNDFTVMSERMSELANKTKEVLK